MLLLKIQQTHLILFVLIKIITHSDNNDIYVFYSDFIYQFTNKPISTIQADMSYEEKFDRQRIFGVLIGITIFAKPCCLTISYRGASIL